MSENTLTDRQAENIGTVASSMLGLSLSAATSDTLSRRQRIEMLTALVQKAHKWNDRELEAVVDFLHNERDLVAAGINV